ncbi:MAG: Rieske 2Fe-2S domain-containing protein [Bacteroidetes bacterium]|nr:Rieske 2Fe-2S domain-containing protein [Bacteroidota bacterium]
MSSIPVCSEQDVRSGRGTRVRVNGEDLVLFRVDEHICAVANNCPHQHFAKLHDGLYENGIVTCPMHGWSFDVRTGAPVNAGGRLRTFPAEVRNGTVYVDPGTASSDDGR